MAPPLAGERNHQPIKHQVRNVPHVVTILKLRKILRKMLRADMNVRAIDAALKLRPHAFDGVCGHAALADVRARFVANRDLVKALLTKEAVGAELVAADSSAGTDRRMNEGFHRPGRAARRTAHRQLAAALFHANDNDLVAHVTVALAANRAANNRLVNLDNDASATKEIIAVNCAYVFADLMAHAPRGFVGDAKLALDFLRGDAVTRRAELEHH